MSTNTKPLDIPQPTVNQPGHEAIEEAKNMQHYANFKRIDARCSWLNRLYGKNDFWLLWYERTGELDKALVVAKKLIRIRFLQMKHNTLRQREYDHFLEDIADNVRAKYNRYY